MLSRSEQKKDFEPPFEADDEEFSEAELEEASVQLTEALTFPPPPVVVVRS